MSFAGADAVPEIAEKTAELLKDKGRSPALRYAMQASGELLADPSDPLRFALRGTVFQQFGTLQVSYQGNDFEVVDYEQYEIWPDLPLFRGPAVSDADLEKGDYFCVIGAAQTMGRLARRPWPVKLGKALGLAPLNLSRAGAGPDVFLDPRIVALARRARFVILQVMSGRSVGCDEFPGGRRISVDGEMTTQHRWEVLEMLWNESREKAIDYVGRWNATYLSVYQQLREAIDRPTLLLWYADREPGGWSPKVLLRKLKWGPFPQLVGNELYGKVAALYDARYEHVTGHSEEATTSRITGAPCPYFGQGRELHHEVKYYPTQQDNRTLAKKLLPHCKAMLAET